MMKLTTKRPDAVAKSATEKAPVKPRETKASKVIALLKRKQGATLDEIVEAAGWLPHTKGAAMTGLKKKGHTIERDKRDNTTCSFVSVTQSFNTINSMGRLTLNMLLSFVQFEREVTAERIRDKIAASKARGM